MMEKDNFEFKFTVKAWQSRKLAYRPLNSKDIYWIFPLLYIIFWFLNDYHYSLTLLLSVFLYVLIMFFALLMVDGYNAIKSDTPQEWIFYLKGIQIKSPKKEIEEYAYSTFREVTIYKEVLYVTFLNGDGKAIPMASIPKVTQPKVFKFLKSVAPKASFKVKPF